MNALVTTAPPKLPDVSEAVVRQSLATLAAHNANAARAVEGTAWLIATSAVWTPWMEPAKHRLSGGISLAEALFVAELPLDLPHLVLVNLVAVPRAAWATTIIRAGDVVLAMALPLGGKKGGSSALRLLAAIAIIVIAAIVAPYLAPEIAAVLGTSLEVATTIATVVVSTVLNMAVNALLPQPSGLGQQEQPSPTYTLNAQGNYTRIGQAIPDQVGRVKHFLDQAADDFTEYLGDEVYLYKTLCCGVGSYSFEEIGFANTWVDRAGTRNPAYDSVELSIIQPGDAPTLFTNVVKASPEVAGSTMLAPNDTDFARLGPYVLNSAGTEAVAIGCDVVFPRGLGKAEDDGSTSSRSVTVTFRARTIDAVGAPTGSWTTIISQTITRKQLNKPVRLTFKAQLAAGRYEVDGGRTSNKASSDRVVDEVVWGQMKAYFAPSTGWPGVTILQLKVRANEQVQGNVASRVYAIKTRKLPWRDGGAWAAAAATRSIAPALAYIVRQFWPDTRIDLDALEALHTIWEGRGDKVDYVFDQKRSAWEQLRLVARCGRARPLIAGGIFTVVRDQPRELANAAFSPRNIIAGSFSMETIIAPEGATDHILAGYMDERTWNPEATVKAASPESAGLAPKRVPFPGITQRAQVFREAIYEDAQDRLRRNFISIETELDGRAVFPGDRALFSHDVPEWGEAAELVSVVEQDDRYVMRASQPFSWRDDDDAHWAAFTRPTGKAVGPLEIFRIAGDPSAGFILKPLPIGTLPAGVPNLNALLWSRQTCGAGDTPSQFLFGTEAESFAIDTSIMEATPRSMDRVSIALVNLDPAIHTADLADPPAETAAPAAPSTENLTITGLTVTVPSPSVGWIRATVTVAGALDAVGFELSIDGHAPIAVGKSPFKFIVYGAPARTIDITARGRFGVGPLYHWSGNIGTDDGGYTGSDGGGGGGGWGGGGGIIRPPTHNDV